jgi:sec-independent protein translocase protein TatA
MPELIIILVIVLVIFGASRLPQLGEGLGKAIKGFKKGISDSPTHDNGSDDAPKKENKG